MSGPEKKRRSHCPVSFALDMFGDKWSLVVVRDLLFWGKTTYGELLEAGDGIATNVLADRLKQLEGSGIITKSRDPDNRRRYLYKLTDKGIALAPILVEMILWSGKYDADTAAAADYLARLEADREAVLAELRAGQQR